jgi:hypothetical protein
MKRYSSVAIREVCSPKFPTQITTQLPGADGRQLVPDTKSE